MIAYLDSSVLLRVLLGQRNALKEWDRITLGVASALVEVECLRTLDRLRLARGLTDEQTGNDLSMATHDGALAVAAKASGLRVIGT